MKPSPDSYINEYNELIDPLDYEYDAAFAAFAAFAEIRLSAISEAEEDWVFNDITHLPCALDYVDTDRSVISWYGEEYTARPEFIRLCSDFMWHQTKAHWVPLREEVEFYAIPF